MWPLLKYYLVQRTVQRVRMITIVMQCNADRSRRPVGLQRPLKYYVCWHLLNCAILLLYISSCVLDITRVIYERWDEMCRMCGWTENIFLHDVIFQSALLSVWGKLFNTFLSFSMWHVLCLNPTTHSSYRIPSCLCLHKNIMSHIFILKVFSLNADSRGIHNESWTGLL